MTKVWFFKQCETVVSFWGWDCTFGQKQEDWSGGKRTDDYTKKLLLLHLAGRNVLQMKKCNSAVSERDISHCPYCVPLVTHSDVAQLLGTKTRGGLLKSRVPLHTQEPQTISLYQSWGAGDTRLVVQRPDSQGGCPSLQGDSSGEGAGTAKVERASAFGKGANENKNNLVDCFSKRCKIVNIYMEIWVLNNR